MTQSSKQSPAAVFPARLTLRDTKVFADEGQRIFTTATGYGYEKCEYVRADLASTTAPEVSELRAKLAEAREAAFEEAAQIAGKVATEQYAKPGYAEHRHTYSMIAEGAREVEQRIRAVKGAGQ